MWPCFCETNASLPGLMAVAVILSEVSSCLSEIFWSIRHGCEVRNVFLSWERSYKSKETRSVFWVESLPEAPYIPSENSQLQILKKKKNNFFFSSQFWNLFPNPSIGTESMAACFSLFTGLCLASVWKCEGRWIWAVLPAVLGRMRPVGWVCPHEGEGQGDAFLQGMQVTY